MVVEQPQPLRYARGLGMLDQRLTALLLLDFGGACEQRFEIAEFVDQQRRSLDADAGNAGDVVGRAAAPRLPLRPFRGRHAEFLDHLIAPDRPLADRHRVEYAHARAYAL